MSTEYRVLITETLLRSLFEVERSSQCGKLFVRCLPFRYLSYSKLLQIARHEAYRNPLQ